MTPLTRRVHQLEAQLEALTAVYDNLSPAEWSKMLFAWLESLIRVGLVPPPDPEHPHASIDALRHAGTHRPELEAMRAAILSDTWQQAHRPAAMALFLRVLRQRM